MKYSFKEVLQYVAEEDVKFIRLVFCDIFGKQKNISIMPSELERAFKYGIAIDASAVKGFGMRVHSDLFLHPDPDTLCVMPWRPEHGKVVRMFCSIKYPDGRIFENDTRGILIEAVEKAKKAGYSFNFGTEIEFYLFKCGDDGEPTKIPYDYASYMDVAPEDKGENVRRRICLHLEKMGIMPESSHHEEGPGQNEVDFRYSGALSAADNVTTFKTVVEAVAAENGLCACFTPKPLEDKPGNGLHMHISIDSDKNDDKVLDKAVSGILKRASELTAFLNPTPESYARLGEFKAPVYISWAHENRSQLVRIPASPEGQKRAELRMPDPSVNPYLALSLIIYACLDGIESNAELPAETDINLFTATPEALSQLKRLPLKYKEALSIAYASPFIREHLPKNIIDEFCWEIL